MSSICNTMNYHEHMVGHTRKSCRRDTIHVIFWGEWKRKKTKTNHKCLHPLFSKISGPEVCFFWLGLRKQMMKLRFSILANFIREQLEAFLFAD